VYIREKYFSDLGKHIGKAFAFLGIYFMAFMPQYFPQLVLGHIGDKPEGFTLTHRLLIYVCILFMFGGYYFLRKKSMEEKKFFLIFLALSGFLQFFSENAYRTDVAGLPLHLCHTAIMLMVFAYVFKLEGIFYFTYTVNVLGALLAILLPNTGDNIITLRSSMVFWYNHTYAFVLPIFGVALGVFPRPNIKLMYKSMVAFSVYVVFATLMNGWLNNSPSLNPGGAVEVDYFFLYSNFLVNKFPFAIPLKSNYVLQFQIGDTMLKVYWLFVLLVWVVYIGLMFLTWGVYAIMYRTSDAHAELAKKAKLMRIDKVNLLRELDGRPLGEPLHPEGKNMIKISNFTKTYAGTDKKAVDNLNLEIYEGEVFGFIGHNGAGKSTTIKSLVGIQSITEGNIEVQGYDVARQPLEAKLSMGYVSDNHAVYENLTGREYISYVADLYMVDEKDKNERLEKYAKMFHLEKALDSEIKCYSHGMKQKTMVIGALIHNPKVWVLDEPLTGLDPTSSWQIKECMRQHADEGNIVFFSSHVIEVVEKVCDRIAIIGGGKLCRVATMDEIKKEGISLEELYLQYAQSTTEQDMDGERV
jgi:ABC-2 type transport system ATP-binding protein